VVFACLAGSVTALEADAELAERTAHRVRALGVTNVRVLSGEATDGAFDAIAVATPGAAISAALLEQLAVGGRLVAAVGPILVRLTRTGPDTFRRDIVPVEEVEA
jgi:protein-L-isoaspartate(D-aspartate) O-methyltransferase